MSDQQFVAQLILGGIGFVGISYPFFPEEYEWKIRFIFLIFMLPVLISLWSKALLG